MSKDNNKIVPTTPIHSDYLPAIPGIKHIPEFLQFVQWSATPKQLRKPKYQKEFAELIGVDQDTLTDWKKHPQFWPLVYTTTSEWIKERIPDAIGSLYKKVMAKGNAKDVEMFLRFGGLDSQTAKERSNKN